MTQVTFSVFRTILTAITVVGLFVIPLSSALAKTDLEVAGWIPYWRDSEGIKDAGKHLADIDVIHPFVFSVRADGSVNDLGGLSDREWKNFIKKAQKKNVEIIPTIMWSDGAAIHRILSDEDLREEHIDHIVELVDDRNFDGIDIDYEAKLSNTIHDFSQFLKELKKELGKNVLTCTIEARTPPKSLYRNVPKVIEYANDYKEIGKHCDRVEIMTYDQQRADILLNNEKNGQPYMPVSDVDWVRKVVELAEKDIPKSKIMLGVPTYGHHYEVTVTPDWFQSYERIGALNVPDILDIAEEYDVTPGRNKAGEMSFSYFPKSSPYVPLKSLPVPKGTQKGNEAAAQALLFANMTGSTVKVRLAWYSDAGAIEDKIDLAKELGLRGIAIFKIDGEEDSKIWRLID